ncbi:MAG: hypothetical protein LYZ70_00035 [Nitrososphaerales archaeon]|nr:hypothetical protein [Nitrososphaerales archaeon]
MNTKRVRLAALAGLILGLAMLFYGLSYHCLELIGVGGLSCYPPEIVPLEWVGASLAFLSLIVLVFTFRRPKTAQSATA